MAGPWGVVGGCLLQGVFVWYFVFVWLMVVGVLLVSCLYGCCLFVFGLAVGLLR